MKFWKSCMMYGELYSKLDVSIASCKEKKSEFDNGCNND